MGGRVLKDVDREKMSKILRVQEMIDFFVLSELQKKEMYLKEIDQAMGEKLAGVSANVSYIGERLRVLEEKGFVERYWDTSSTRYNHYARITEAGKDYFAKLLAEVPKKIERALQFYGSLKKIVKNYGHWYVSKNNVGEMNE